MRRSIALALALLTAASAAGAGEGAWTRAEQDTTCAPCRDFFRYANGGWVDHATIPAAYPGWGSFAALADQNQKRLLEILQVAAANRAAKPGSPDRIVGDYWNACMDSAGAEAAGTKPIEPLLAQLDGLKGAADLARSLGWMHAHGVRAAFGLFPGPDAKRSNLTIANASQGGLGLPDRDFYTRPDSMSQSLRDAYVAHVARVFGLLGRPDAEDAAKRVMALETALAQASMTNVQRRDPKATYHFVPLDSLRAWAPALDWNVYFATRAMRAPDSLNVGQPDFFRALSRLASSVPAADWQDYLRWKIADDAAGTLSNAWVLEDFAFRKRLTGTKELLPRWKRCIQATDQDLGDALGQMYVRKHFPPAARDRALVLVKNLEAALGERIAALDWMSDATKQAARVKLDAFANHIGYPASWRDYKGLAISPSDFAANRRAAQLWELQRQLARIGGPVKKDEWRMSAPTVNAFYAPPFNSINFPAGILQPPFYDASWDDALNYGGIGAVIGHEMTHGFDDQGRQYDADGNLRDWWTADDASRYKERADKVAAQFDAFEVPGGLHVNGKLTLGENIADLGGLAVAYAALQKALEGKPRTTIDGYTPEQRFFLSYARVWRSTMRPEALQNMVKTNPHSPAMFRVNGPLSNLDEFRKAFGCQEGDAMVRAADQRARIW